MKRKDLDIQRKELGMPEANKKFEVIASSIIKNNDVKNIEDIMALTDQTLIKLGFTQEETDNNSYYFIFEITSKKGNKITLISDCNDTIDNGQYTVRLFDTPFFQCKTISDVREVVKIALKYQ